MPSTAMPNVHWSRGLSTVTIKTGLTEGPTESLLWGRGAVLHQVLEVGLLRGDLKVTDVAVSLQSHYTALVKQITRRLVPYSSD